MGGGGLGSKMSRNRRRLMVCYGKTKIAQKLNAQENHSALSVKEKAIYSNKSESQFSYQKMQVKRARMSGQESKMCLSGK